MHVGLACLSTTAAWRCGPSPKPEVFSLLHIPGAIPLSLANRTMFFEAAQLFRFRYDPSSRDWKCSTLAYSYSLAEDAQLAEECIAWHWHPGTSGEPHLHVRTEHPALGRLARLHLPTGHVSFESVVRFLIDDLGVECQAQEGWRRELADAEPKWNEDRFRSTARHP
jgi:hypothetical protein